MFNRAAEVRARVSGTSSWPAPAQGWVQSGNIVLAPKQQAEVLDNFIPTAQGIRLRGGASEYADIGASVVRMFTYASGGAEDFFAATETEIYDLVAASAGGVFPQMTGTTSGDWSATQIGTSGGQFLVAVNGADDGRFWDGSEWNLLLGTAPNELAVEWLSADFDIGATITGGSSGATADVLAIERTGIGTARLILGAITGGPFTSGETVTGASAAAGKNVITQSEAFDNAFWTKTQVTVTANAGTAPDGAATADKIVEAATSIPHQVNFTYSNSNFALGDVFTFSVYAKAAERNIVRMTIDNSVLSGPSDLSLQVNLSDGSYDLFPQGVEDEGADVFGILKGFGVEDVGSGWYRISLTFPIQDATGNLICRMYLTSAGNIAYLGDGTSGALLWGGQLEKSSRVTSYEATTGALRTSASAEATANSASATAVTLTNVATSALSQVWLFKRRLFFVEKDTTSAWYLPVDSIGGAAVEFDLGANFRKGGSLLFGATWSLDSGEGLDDVCLFVSDQGEVAVYEGTDPSDANAWRLAGVYDIGKPLDKHAWFKTGGDLAILTEGGIIPASEALRKDRAALQTVAVSFAIEDAWKEAIQQRTTEYPVNALLWQSGGLLMVGTPATYRGRNVAFLANAQTGAWARVTGWDVRCQAVFGDELYFANSDGKVLKADSGGNDDGVAFTGVWVPKFEAGSDLRTVNAVGITYRATEELMGDLDAHADYNVSDIVEPAATITSDPGVWGSGVWGVFAWGNDANLNTYTEWQAAFANGYAVAPSLAITSNQPSRVVFEPLILRARTEVGYAL